MMVSCVIFVPNISKKWFEYASRRDRYERDNFYVSDSYKKER